MLVFKREKRKIELGLRLGCRCFGRWSGCRCFVGSDCCLSCRRFGFLLVLDSCCCFGSLSPDYCFRLDRRLLGLQFPWSLSPCSKPCNFGATTRTPTTPPMSIPTKVLLKQNRLLPRAKRCVLTFCVYSDGGAKIFVSEFFLGFGPGRLRIVFHGVVVDVVGFNCFSALIAATNGGAGCNNNNFFSVVDLSWYF